MGLAKEDVLVTNTVQCHTYTLNKDAVPICSRRMLNEVWEHPRQLVIALGKTAAEALLNRNVAITQERGTLHETTEGNIFLTVHPAFILRGGARKAILEADMAFAKDVWIGNQAKPIIPRGKLLKEKTIWEVVNELLQAESIACDIETSGFSSRQEDILCIAVSADPKRVWVIPEELVKHPATKYLFSEFQGKWVWQNGKFDIQFLRANGIEGRVDYDTMLMHYTQEENRGTHDLGSLATNYLRAPEYKDESNKGSDGKKIKSFRSIPLPILYDRVILDTSYTFQIFDKLYDPVYSDEKSKWLLDNVIMPGQEFLSQVEARGIWVNPHEFNAVKTELVAEVNILEWQLQLMANPYLQTGATFNPNSPPQLKELLYHKMGLKPPRGFQENARKETLEKVAQTPFVRTLRDYKRAFKLTTTYVNGLERQIESDSRIHCTFLLHGTVTGRLSCSNPNLQTIPRDSQIKGVFQAPPGYVLMEADYSQAELRALAIASKDPWLWKALTTPGKKLHEIVAEEMYGPNYSKDEYAHAKMLNFGVVYGREAYSIALEYGIDVTEAQSWIDKWFAPMPRVKAYLEHCKSIARRRGTIVSHTGRRRRFTDVNVRDLAALHAAENEACNFFPQTTASDLTLQAGIMAQNEFNERFEGRPHVVNLVHDSLIVECPVDLIAQVKEVLERCMTLIPTQHPLNTEMPFPVDIETHQVWGGKSLVPVS